MTKPTSAGYDHGGTTPKRVATFTVPRGRIGEWRIEVTGTTGPDGGSFAVGEFDLQGFMRMHQWGIVALVLVNAGAAAAIAVLPIVRRRRTA